MSSIKLTVHDPSSGSSALSGTVARLQNLGESGKASRWVHEQMVPTKSDEPLSMPVEPGDYLVQLILPTGRILTKEARVGPDEDVPIEFLRGIDLGQAARAVGYLATGLGQLGFPYLSAIGTLTHGLAAAVERERMPVAARAAIPRKRVTAAAKPPVPKIELAPGLTAQGGEGDSRARRMAILEQKVEVGADIWRSLGGDEPVGWANLPLKGKRARFSSDDTSLWVLPHPPTRSRNLRRVNVRHWALHKGNETIDLASVPAPWRDFRSQGRVQVEAVGIQGAELGETGLALAVDEPDEGINGLLNLLAHGRLAVARTMLNAVEQEGIITRAIEMKTANPLAACAAAYVGLAIFDPNEQEQWDIWLPNICRWFPWIPDGAIVHARRIMLRPHNAQEAEQILPLLKDAFRRGVPYYSVGMQLLRDMLGVCGKDREAHEMHELVSRVASRLDGNQAFTVLRYPT